MIQISRWDEFQHFKQRDPIWIKLYRKLRNDRMWRTLPAVESKMLVDLWMLAADGDDAGMIDLTYEEVAWELRMEPDEVSACLEVIERHGFIKMISERYQEDTPHALTRERDREEKETETETEPTHTARESDELSEWLNGNHDHLPDSPVLSDSRVRQTLYSHYGPPGMRSSAWKRDDGTSVPPEERPRILALTLSGYLGLEGKGRIIANEFDGALKATARRELGDQASDNALPFPGAGT